MLDTSVFYAPPRTPKHLTFAQLAEKRERKRRYEQNYRANNPERWEQLRQAREQRIKDRYCSLRAYVDHDTGDALKRAATKQNVTVSELIRTYITWGLETDGEID
jgi:acyl-CoA reductase-like NAD-dependent aldehyde dehydrogenase